MARLRDLINVTTEDDLRGAAGPIDGNQFNAQTTCYERCETSYHNNCCIAFLTPAGVECATIEVWGGGGGGAGFACCDPDTCAKGQPGGAGAYVVRCLTNLSEGDRFDMIVGNATGCSYQWQGCQGCYSCVCGAGGVELCAQGGRSGEIYCNWGCGSCCSGTASASGGDINIEGKYGIFCARCAEWGTSQNFNQIFLPYPGGINNLCGGWLQIQTPCCGACIGCNYQVQCRAGEMLEGLGSIAAKDWGYIPGLPFASHYGGCQCECNSNCTCGGPGTAGMVRITYK